MKRFAFSLVTLATLPLLVSQARSLAADVSPNLQLARQLNQAFIEVAEKVSPTVVVINVVQKVTPLNLSEDEGDGTFDNLPPGFWRRFHQEFEHQPQQALGQGSGFIIRKNGYILTNRHVVEDAESIEVRLQDGRNLKATVRGLDPQSDLAVVKIDADSLPVATFADSAKARVGEFAIAIGAPFSLDYSVTFGHVSAKSRSNVLEGYEAAAMDQDFIQTDALINPGNSGGPLVNIEGEVIGINTLIRGLRTGIGFAIPSNLAKEISDQLIDHGKVTRAWLGIGIRAVRDNPELRDVLKGIDDGVVVAQILPDGPAAKSDLKASDVITSVEGVRVSTPQQLRNVVRNKPIGRPLTLDVLRNGKNLQVKVNPGEMAEPTVSVAKATSAPAPRSNEHLELGIKVQTLTPDLAAKFGVEKTDGVLIAAVDKNSLAARKGLQPGDVITSVNQQAVSSPKEFHAAIDKADLKKGVLLNLLSDKTSRFEILKAEP